METKAPPSEEESSPPPNPPTPIGKMVTTNIAGPDVASGLTEKLPPIEQQQYAAASREEQKKPVKKRGGRRNFLDDSSGTSTTDFTAWMKQGEIRNAVDKATATLQNQNSILQQQLEFAKQATKKEDSGEFELGPFTISFPSLELKIPFAIVKFDSVPTDNGTTMNNTVTPGTSTNKRPSQNASTENPNKKANTEKNPNAENSFESPLAANAEDPAETAVGVAAVAGNVGSFAVVAPLAASKIGPTAAYNEGAANDKDAANNEEAANKKDDNSNSAQPDNAQRDDGQEAHSHGGSSMDWPLYEANMNAGGQSLNGGDLDDRNYYGS